MPIEVLGWIITGGVAAAAVKLIESLVVWRLNRKAKLSDDVKANEAGAHKKKEAELAEVVKVINDLKRAQKVILHDRIKYLGHAYIRAEAISYDDRRDLVEMHGIYHSELGGNGNLDHLMNDVMKLPIKK